MLTLALTYNGDYVECFDHETCEHNYDTKIYCYVGTCTDRCPPGYKQVNTDSGWDFECKCWSKKGLVGNSTFPHPFANLSIPMCKCDKPYCFVTVYSVGIGYTDGLVPNGSPPNCKVKLDEIPAILTQFATYMILIMMIILMFIHCRSSSGIVYDFHRYYGIYVLGSTMVIVFVQTVYPFTAGFTRTMAFGIIAHNSAEWNILLRLQYGKASHVRNSTNVCLIMYYLILLFSMAFLRLDHLLFFAMVQGGFLDWSFVWFIFAARKTIIASDSDERVVCQCCKAEYATFVCWFGFAAITHLLSVEILFAGFILNKPVLIGAGGFLLVPMFMFYTIWVFRQEGLLIFCGPSVFMNYVKNGISASEASKFLIVPFKHTTRTVDILWKRFVGEGYIPVNKVDVEMEQLDVEWKEVGRENPERTDGDASAKGTIAFSTSGKFEVEDCESFKFGINDRVRKCPQFECCLRKISIPCYWVAAFICISINTVALINLPMLQAAHGCPPGYGVGAW